MILYHGSNTDITEIILDKCKPYKDFGRGFYLTTLYDQAAQMAKKVAGRYGKRAYVNIYEFDESNLRRDTLSVKRFDGTSKEWMRFIMNNRDRSYTGINNSECNLDNKYDIVMGPVADDDLATLFKLFKSGIITVENMNREMVYRKINDQVSFHTEKGISLLRKTGVEYE